MAYVAAQKQIIAYWSSKFQISSKSFEREGTSFFPSTYLNERRKIIIFQTKKRNFIFYPNIYLKSFSRFSSSNEKIGASELNIYLPSLSLEQRGTDYYFYWMSAIPQHKTVKNLRLLKPSDEAALLTLQQSATNHERELGDVDIKHSVVIGWFFGNKLLSVGSLIIENDVADIGILTHPEARGKGLGKLVVRTLIGEGLKRNKLVQYTSMQKNIASVALANSLGFEQFATETYWNVNV